MRRKSAHYFDTPPGAPEPVSEIIRRRLRFSEADPLGIAWHGNYARFFEDAQTELARKLGIGPTQLADAGIAAPVVQLHIDYRRMLKYDDEFTVRATLFWNDGARLNTEYEIRGADGEIAASGYGVQVFTDLRTREPLWFSPDLWERCRARWKAGEFA